MRATRSSKSGQQGVVVIEAMIAILLFSLGVLAAVLIGYFVFLFKASDKEYREVIDEKFNGK